MFCKASGSTKEGTPRSTLFQDLAIAMCLPNTRALEAEELTVYVSVVLGVIAPNCQSFASKCELSPTPAQKSTTKTRSFTKVVYTEQHEWQAHMGGGVAFASARKLQRDSRGGARRPGHGGRQSKRLWPWRR